jgi:starvation-inducible DNA-binding protein
MEQNPLIDKLNVVLSDLHVFYQKLRNFHWNVTGSDFYELHKMFESQYDTIYENIDDLAEYIRQLNSYPVSTLFEYIKLSNIVETNELPFNSNDMVNILYDDTVTMCSYIESNFLKSEINDVITQDKMTSLFEVLSKMKWFLNASKVNQLEFNNDIIEIMFESDQQFNQLMEESKIGNAVKSVAKKAGSNVKKAVSSVSKKVGDTAKSAGNLAKEKITDTAKEKITDTAKEKVKEKAKSGLDKLKTVTSDKDDKSDKNSKTKDKINSAKKTIKDTAKDPIKASTIAGAVVGGATGGAIGFGVGNMVKDVADGVKEVKNKLLESSELEFKTFLFQNNLLNQNSLGEHIKNVSKKVKHTYNKVSGNYSRRSKNGWETRRKNSN